MKRIKQLAIITAGIFISYAAMISFFANNKRRNSLVENRISVSGRADNVEGQAAIVSDSNIIYFVWGMDKWEEDWLNHRIKIVGDLAEGITASKKIIKDAVVQMVYEK